MNNVPTHMGFSNANDFDGKEIEAPLLIDEYQNESRWDDIVHQNHNHNHNHVVEVDFEFWPVEHPLEPPDEDRPVKCPMPNSSVINDGGIRKEKRYSDQSQSSVIRKRSEVSSAYSSSKQRMEEDVPMVMAAAVAVAEPPPPPVRAVRKRHHHTLTRGDHMISPLRRMPPLPSRPTQSITVFQMLQQFDKFES